MPGSDWRVQVATVVVDGLLVLGICLLLGLHVLDATIGVALLGPLIGARAAVHKARAQDAVAGATAGATAVVNNAGGAIAIAIGFGTILTAMLRAKGHVAMFLLVLLGVGVTAGVSHGRTVTGNRTLFGPEAAHTAH